MRKPGERKDAGPGVPEAVPRGLQRLLQRYGGAALDRVWIFPPLVSGRRESGLLVASVFTDAHEPERRVLVSSPYSAERTGKGLRLDWTLQEQGEAPADRFPRVVDGVVRRAEKDLGEPRLLVVEGDEAVLLEALDEYAVELLDPDLSPRALDEPDAQEGEGLEGEQIADAPPAEPASTLAGEVP